MRLDKVQVWNRKIFKSAKQPTHKLIQSSKSGVSTYGILWFNGKRVRKRISSKMATGFRQYNNYKAEFASIMHI